jgi:hypothetical protein
MTKKRIKEGLSDEAMSVDRDHEVQMARAQLYHLANDAIRLHKLLKSVSEAEGLEGWMQSKITLAADYIKSTADYLEYDKLKTPKSVASAPMMPTAGMPESVSAGGMGAGSIATAPAPMRKKTLIRR